MASIARHCAGWGLQLILPVLPHHHSVRFVRCPYCACLEVPPVVFTPPALPSVGRRVWPEHPVASATLQAHTATAADWNRNQPIYVSLQAGSGPFLVLTDYLVSIQTGRVSQLGFLGKRPQPACFFFYFSFYPRAPSPTISCPNYALFCAYIFCCASLSIHSLLLALYLKR